MTDFYDPETKQAPPPRKLSRAEITGNFWAQIAEEIRVETGIPRVDYSYFDNRNEFEVRLRGQPAKRVMTEFGLQRIIGPGIMENLHKDFVFKGEGKSPYANRTEMEKWQGAIIKWAKSLDGKAEMEASNGTQTQAQAKQA